MSNEDEPNLVFLYSDLWGEQAAQVTVLAKIVEVCKGAMFSGDLRGELERIQNIAGEGLEFLDSLDEKPAHEFGFQLPKEDK